MNRMNEISEKIMIFVTNKIKRGKSVQKNNFSTKSKLGVIFMI